MSTITQNVSRLNHLLALYKLSRTDLLEILNDGRVKKLTFEDIFSENIRIPVLKKVDTVFGKGLSYYVDPETPLRNKEESIFFRKEKFNVDLNLTAKQIVNKFENEKILFSTLQKLSDVKIDRLLPIYKTSDSPLDVAKSIRGKLQRVLTNQKADRLFLKDLIAIFAEFNILVFEFVEARNKKLKANIDGFYTTPNVIVIKWQKYPKREIFTLLHELGHYLLNREDVDDTSLSENLVSTTNLIERWCNDFAFYFLIGNHKSLFDSLIVDENENYRDTIYNISRITHLSTLALYTRLLYSNRISSYIYDNIVNEINDAIFQYEMEMHEKQAKELLKLELEGRRPIIPLPKPNISPLYKEVLQVAFYNGFLNELEFCKKLQINPTQLEATLR